MIKENYRVKRFDPFVRQTRSELLITCPYFEALKGWMKLEEAEVLFQAAKQVRKGVIVEIGSAAGKSTVALSKGAAAGFEPAVFAVDPHEEFIGLYGSKYGSHFRKAFYETMLQTGCWSNVRLLNVSSEILSQGWSDPVGLLWIDGDHRYEAVRRDVDCWIGHVISGSMIIFDDANQSPSAPRTVIEQLCEDGLARYSGGVGKIMAVEKL